MAQKKEKVNVVQLTNEKYLNLFSVEYAKRGVKWFIASRRKKENLEVLRRSDHADAVSVLPYSKDSGGQMTIYLIKEFRHALNERILSCPAGLVENGKTDEQTVESEIYEEIGGKVLSSTCIGRSLFSTAGLTDEKISFFEAQVRLTGKQHLEKTEDIEIVAVSLDEAQKMLNDDKFVFDAKGKLALSLFLTRLKLDGVLADNQRLEKRKLALEKENKKLQEKLEKLEAKSKKS